MVRPRKRPRRRSRSDRARGEAAQRPRSYGGGRAAADAMAAKRPRKGEGRAAAEEWRVARPRSGRGNDVALSSNCSSPEEHQSYSSPRRSPSSSNVLSGERGRLRTFSLMRLERFSVSTSLIQTGPMPTSVNRIQAQISFSQMTLGLQPSVTRCGHEMALNFRRVRSNTP